MGVLDRLRLASCWTVSRCEFHFPIFSVNEVLTLLVVIQPTDLPQLVSLTTLLLSSIHDIISWIPNCMPRFSLLLRAEQICMVFMISPYIGVSFLIFDI